MDRYENWMFRDWKEGIKRKEGIEREIDRSDMMWGRDLQGSGRIVNGVGAEGENSTIQKMKQRHCWTKIQMKHSNEPRPNFTFALPSQTLILRAAPRRITSSHPPKLISSKLIFLL